MSSNRDETIVLSTNDKKIIQDKKEVDGLQQIKKKKKNQNKNRTRISDSDESDTEKGDTEKGEDEIDEIKLPDLKEQITFIKKDINDLRNNELVRHFKNDSDIDELLKKIGYQQEFLNSVINDDFDLNQHQLKTIAQNVMLLRSLLQDLHFSLYQKKMNSKEKSIRKGKLFTLKEVTKNCQLIVNNIFKNYNTVIDYPLIKIFNAQFIFHIKKTVHHFSDAIDRIHTSKFAGDKRFDDIKNLLKNIDDKKSVEGIIDILNKIQGKVIEQFNAIIQDDTLDIDKRLYCTLLKDDFYEIKREIMREWCTYWNKDESDKSKFGFYNPALCMQSNEINSKNKIHPEIMIIKEVCSKELAKDLKFTINRNIREMGESTSKKRQKLIQIPLKQRIKKFPKISLKLWIYLLTNQVKKDHKLAKQSAQTAIKSLETQNKAIQEANNPSFIINESIKLNSSYNQKLNSGISVLDTIHKKIRTLFRGHRRRVNQVFTNYQPFINFMATNEDNLNTKDLLDVEITNNLLNYKSIRTTLYQDINLAKNNKMWKKAELKINGIKNSLLSGLAAEVKIDNSLSTIKAKFLDLDLPHEDLAEHYLKILYSLTNQIFRLRAIPNILNNARAKALEELCQEIVLTHVMNDKLNFSISQIEGIVDVIVRTASPKSTQAQLLIDNLCKKLVQKKLIQMEGGEGTDSNEVNPTARFIPEEKNDHVSLFEKQFTYRFTSMLIGNYALASGLLVGKISDLGAVMSGLASGVSALTGAPSASGVIKLADQFIQEDVATEVIANMPLDTQLISKLASFLSNVFLTQINSISHPDEIKTFVEFPSYILFFKGILLTSSFSLS